MLLASAVAFADSPGQSRSTFVPRADATTSAKPITVSVPSEDAPPAKPVAISAPREKTQKAGLAAPVPLAQTKGETSPPKPIVPVQAKSDVPTPKKDGVPSMPPPIGARPGQDPYEAYIRLEPPGRERLFGTRDSERELEERMRQERRDSGVPGDPIVFPERPEIGGEGFQQRKFEPMICQVEPSYIVYRRLFFEEKNSERYGWECGYMQPAISTLYFFRDVALLPHNMATYPCRRFETNAGQCRPGDPTPYLLYPPEFTSSGLIAEAGVIAMFAAIVPIP